MKNKSCFTRRLNQNKLSCRKVVMRHLRIFVSVGMINERKEIRRSRIETFRDDRLLLNNNYGFTLIELLAVVLIIGILAAVALPQYQKAVEKSRAASVLALLKAVGEADQAYHLANGSWATTFDELDVEVPWTGNEKWSTYDKVTDTRSNGEWSIQIRENDSNALVHVGRLTGPYAGVGFVYYLEGKNWAVPEGTIGCTERTGLGVTYSGAKGSYCGKIIPVSYEIASDANGSWWAM